MSDAKQARRFFVSGSVQGVGFRYFTQHVAERLRIGGYTQNLPDGRVEVYAIGTVDQLAKLHTALQRGPAGARVAEVQEEPASIDLQHLNDFSITFYS